MKIKDKIKTILVMVVSYIIGLAVLFLTNNFTLAGMVSFMLFFIYYYLCYIKNNTQEVTEQNNKE